MYIIHDYIKFTKNLPDCRESSLTSYLEQLIDTVQNWPLKKQVNFNPLRIKTEFVHFEPSRIRTEFKKGYSQRSKKSLPSFCCQFWKYPCRNRSCEKRVSFNICFCLTKMPHVFGTLEPPIIQRKQYENLMTEALKNGIFDGIASQADTPIITSLGKLNWAYVIGKITEFKTLSWLWSQEKSLCNEPSMVYEFAQQIESIFSLLPTITSPYIESQMRDFDLGSEEMELDEMTAEYEKKKAEFLDKYDKILLDAWGEKQFSNHLIPLGVSLEQWLKAGKD
jgi:hypothetical protein